MGDGNSVFSVFDINKRGKHRLQVEFVVVCFISILIYLILITEIVVIAKATYATKLQGISALLVDAAILIFLMIPLFYFIYLRPKLKYLSEKKMLEAEYAAIIEQLSIDFRMRNRDLRESGELLSKKLSAQKKIEESLRNSNIELETRIKDCNAALDIAGEKLQREVSERKAAENALAVEKSRLFLVFEDLPAYVYFLSPDYKIRYANRKFYELFGSWQNTVCYKLFHNRDLPCEDCRTLSVFASGIPRSWENQTDDNRFFQAFTYPFTDVDGTTQIIELGIDITRRKHAECELLASEQRFRTLVKSIDDLVFKLDIDGRFTEFHGSWLEKMSIDEASLIGKSVNELLNDADTKVHVESFSRVINGERMVYEWQYLNNGYSSYFNISLSPVFGIDGQVEAVVGIARDITRLKQLDKQLNQSEKLLVLGEMAAIISHEFRNSLSTLRMLIELRIEREKADDRGKESLIVMLRSISQMEEIVAQLVSFSRPKPLTIKAENINQLILESIDLIRIHAINANVKICTNLAAELPRMMIDGTNIKKCLMNVMLNAVQAMSAKNNPEDKRVLTINSNKCFLKETLRDIAYRNFNSQNNSNNHITKAAELVLPAGTLCVQIEVADTGTGIAPEHISEIFDAFYTTKPRGTGLGLLMVKRTVNAHGGIIKVESSPGEGTAFKIVIPISVKGIQHE